MACTHTLHSIPPLLDYNLHLCIFFFGGFLFYGAAANANAAASRRHECQVSPYWILAGWHALKR